MGNTSLGRAKKGSKFWMQEVVNQKELKERLDIQIGECVNWLTPLENENYREYELKQLPLFKDLDLPLQEKQKLFSFWPNRQPQWDAIGISENGKTLYLVEAKAHAQELKSKMSASSESSTSLIRSTMQSVFDEKYFHTGGVYFFWETKYYQMANRLTFLDKTNEIICLLQKRKSTSIEQVKLIFLNFTDDPTYKPTTKERMEKEMKQALVYLTGRSVTPNNVQELYFSTIME